MSSAPIGENSVASAIVITPPCPLLKYPAGHGTFSTTSMMPPKRGATHPPYELFMDELLRIHLPRTPVNKGMKKQLSWMSRGRVVRRPPGSTVFEDRIEDREQLAHAGHQGYLLRFAGR